MAKAAVISNAVAVQNRRWKPTSVRKSASADGDRGARMRFVIAEHDGEEYAGTATGTAPSSTGGKAVERRRPTRCSSSQTRSAIARTRRAHHPARESSEAAALRKQPVRVIVRRRSKLTALLRRGHGQDRPPVICTHPCNRAGIPGSQDALFASTPPTSRAFPGWHRTCLPNRTGRHTGHLKEY